MAGEPETRMVVFDIRNYKGAGWPNGLALDYETKRLYWVDARFVLSLYYSSLLLHH